MITTFWNLDSSVKNAGGMKKAFWCDEHAPKCQFCDDVAEMCLYCTLVYTNGIYEALCDVCSGSCPSHPHVVLKPVKRVP